MNRGFFAWVCIIAGLLMAFVWLLSAAGVIGGVDEWIKAGSVFALALGVVAGWLWPPVGIRR
jgi:hypothetical protein